MSKRVTKAELSKKIVELEEAKQFFLKKIEQLEGILIEKKEYVSSLKSDLEILYQRMNFVNGRCAEIIISHDILLRTSLREQDMSWDDIEKIIIESRRHFAVDIGFNNGDWPVKNKSMGRGY